MSEKIPTRAEVPMQDRWAIEDLYATDELWQQDFEKLKDYQEELSAFAGKLSKSGESLLAFMKKSEELSVLLDRVANYAQRRSDEDTANSHYQAMVGQLTKAYVALSQALSFEEPELLSIPDETMEQFYQETPELELYRRHFDVLRRQKAHILPLAEEMLLAGMGEMAGTPENIFSMFSDADLRFEPAADSEGKQHPISQSTYISCMESPDRTLRKNAFTAYYAQYQTFRNTMAAALSGQVQQLAFFARARKYNSSLDASLSRANVPVSVYHSLIEAVHENLDKMYRYVRLRKKLLGVDALHMYDLYTPLVASADEKIPYEQAKQTVLDALSVMGKDYQAILQEGFCNRWIDVYENVGKRSGAYSAGARVHPYVLLNYTGTLDSQFTIAHEMGHAIHSYLSNKTQPVIYSDYVIFVAEVASTCNEALLMRYLLGKTTDKKQRAYLINHFLEQFRGTLYRQTMFAEFELKIAELNDQGISLTADKLCEEYRALNRLYYGGDIVLDEQIDMEWARIPHFYYNYYVYQYATGFAAAIALSSKILTEGDRAVDAYLSFLKGGCSKDPIDLLKGAGVDMTGTEPIKQALKLFDSLLDEMEALTD